MVNHKCDPLYDMDESEKEDEEDEVELRSGRSSTVRSAVAAFSSTSSRVNPRVPSGLYSLSIFFLLFCSTASLPPEFTSRY